MTERPRMTEERLKEIEAWHHSHRLLNMGSDAMTFVRELIAEVSALQAENTELRERYASKKETVLDLMHQRDRSDDEVERLRAENAKRDDVDATFRKAMEMAKEIHEKLTKPTIDAEREAFHERVQELEAELARRDACAMHAAAEWCEAYSRDSSSADFPGASSSLGIIAKALRAAAPVPMVPREVALRACYIMRFANDQFDRDDISTIAEAIEFAACNPIQNGAVGKAFAAAALARAEKEAT